MRIAICDDNKLITSSIEEYIANLPFKDIEYDIFFSGDDLIKYIENNQLTYNIYFMDIEMPGSNGIETSKYIRETDQNALIIFVTDHKQYVYNVFDVLPFRFLPKPIDEQSLDNVLGEAMEHIKKMKQVFFFKQGKMQFQVPFDDILFFEGKGRKVRIVTFEAEYEYYDKISNIKERIDMNLFLQIHVSYLVNMDKIRLIKESQVFLENQAVLHISKRFKKEVKELHLKYMEWRCGK